VAKRLAALCLRAPWLQPLLQGPALIVPVPLHPRREVRRGFNQASLIARELARATGLRLGEGVLVRRVDTPAQTGLPARARRHNVARAFAVRRASALSGRRVLLVDDVVTTGATVRSCARALREAGATQVSVLSMARVD
jgi:ComF family protein